MIRVVRKQTRVTMADVAREAGVSKMTVSRVLNHKGEISDATRVKVLEIIEDLGYMPHAQAQRLGRGASRTIALLYPLVYLGNQPINLMELDFIIGAATTAREADYFFNLLPLPVTEADLLAMYRGSQVDGVILMQIHLQDWRVDLLKKHNYPFVIIGRCADNTGLSWIDLDFEGSVQTAFDYLVGLGHRQIGFLSFPDNMRQEGYGPAVRAMTGYEKALAKHGIEAYYREVNFGVQDMYEAAISLLEETPSLTAIISPHDVAIFGVLRALRKLDRSVPRDISLVGLSTDKVAELLTPPLTSVRFPTDEMGYQAAQMLIATLRGQAETPKQILVGPELIVRKSSAPAKSH